MQSDNRVLQGSQPADRPAESPACPWLALLLLASLALRLAFALHWYGAVHFSDAIIYHGLAVSLLQDGAYPTAYFPPGYPAFVAAVYAIFGEHQLPVRVIQALAGTLGVWVAYLLAIEILGSSRRGIGLLAATLYGLSPGVAYFAGWLWREAWMTLLLPLSVWLCFRMLTRSWKYALPLGLVVAAAVYVRSESWLIVFFVVGLGLLHRPWRRRALTGGALAACVIVAGVAPWVLHCSITRGYAAMDLGATGNLFAAVWHLSPEGQAEPDFRRHVLEQIRKHQLPERRQRTCELMFMLLGDLPEGEVPAQAALLKKMRAVALENIRRRPLAYLRRLPVNLGHVILGQPFEWHRDRWVPSVRDSLREGHLGVLAMKGFNYLVWPATVFPLVGVALVWAHRKRDVSRAALTIATAAVFLLILTNSLSGATASPRMRVTSDAVLGVPLSLGLALVTRRARPLPEQD